MAYYGPPPPWFWYNHYNRMLENPNGYPSPCSPYFNQNELPDPPVIPDDQRPSKLLPTVNPAIAADTMPIDMVWDIRYPPQTEIPSYAWAKYYSTLAVSHSTPEINLLLRGTPWRIIVRPNSYGVITVGDILRSIYDNLQQPIDDTEWGFIIKNDEWRNQVVKQASKRKKRDHTAEAYFKKIDWMGDTNAMFEGLEPDPKFEKWRQTPGLPSVRDTFTVKLGRQKNYR